MFIEDRNGVRDYFFLVWEKINKQLPLEPLEAVISAVILQHPEYHAYLADKHVCLNSDFKPEQNRTNPFLHMGMHIALKEQLGMDRPSGIKSVFDSIMSEAGSEHDAEHKMMACLEQSLWEAQCNNTLPDETAYLECLRRIV